MPIYIITLALFIIVQVPTALTTNFGVVIFLRFLAGFIGSPVLATGGASLADVYKPEDCASIMGLWGVVGTGGPSLGPLLGGFAAQAKGWTWTIWILMWAAGLAFIILVFFLPETSSQTYASKTVRRIFYRADRFPQLIVPPCRSPQTPDSKPKSPFAGRKRRPAYLSGRSSHYMPCTTYHS